MTNIQLLTGNALDILKGMESESVQCIITSPPFYNQRKYLQNNINEIGQEKTINEYITNLVNVFDECKRVLRNEGSLWIEINDSYNQKTGSLYGVPQRLYTTLIDRNWISRNEIIWHKPNCMVGPWKTRFTIDFSHLYWFTKSRKYKFHTQYEPMVYQYRNLNYSGQDIKDYKSAKAQSPSDSKRRILESYKKQAIKFGGNKYPDKVGGVYSGNVWEPNEQLMRIKRTTWRVVVRGTRLAHCAAFTPELVETPIISCSDPGDTILDCFSGIGVVGKMAKKHNRNYIGIELSEEFNKLAEQNIKTGK